MSVNDPISQNIIGVQQLVGSKLNKTNKGASTQEEGVTGEAIDVLALDLSDEELLSLAKKWETRYAPYESKIKQKQEANKTYYLGLQKEGSAQATTEGQPISNNVIFEAEETLLPAIFAKNPEPVVWADNSPEGTKLSSDVKTMLQYHADKLVLRQKLKLATRKWTIDLIGVLKHGWDDEIEDIKTEVRNAKNFVFDPEGYVDAYGDFIGYLGERVPTTAEKLIEMFPSEKAYITIMVDGKLGTPVTYTEWWSDDDKYYFCTFKDKVLDKGKNAYFVYPEKTNDVDEDGQEIEREVKARNHFARPKKPYTFLSVFSLAEQPHDITGLIEQNIPNQRRITRRTEQIDFNLSRANNSDAFSEDNFTQETAKQAAKALAMGHPVLVPKGRPIGEAITRLPAPTLSPMFLEELQYSEQVLRQSFGTQGITALGPKNEEKTARGMILSQQYDNSRLGGIGDAIEQVADNVFNWWVQLYHVYYDEDHFAQVTGQLKAIEFITLSANRFDRPLSISVAPDSMKPKDELTEMNQALDLWREGALDPKTLLTVLDFPDPSNTAALAALWRTNPQTYIQLVFPELAQQLQQQAQIQAQAQQGGMVQLGQQTTQSPVAPAEQSISGVEANPSLSQVQLPQ